ncbi:MAG: DMT family transporter [Rhodospirillales bacterium]
MSAPPSAPAGQQNVPLAALWMGGVLTSFLLMAVAVREASAGLSAIDLLFYRSLVALLIVVTLAGASKGGLGLLRTRRPGAQALRNVCLFVGQFGWIYAIAAIPLAQVFAIEFTTPLWVGLLAPLVLGEKLTGRRLIALLLGFLGILAVVRPGMVALSPGVLAILIGAIGFALGAIMTKRLTTTERPITVLFYMSLVQALISAPPSLLDPVVPDATTALWVVAVALAGLSAHYCLVRALTLADAMTVAPMDFLRLPLVMVLAALLYGEALDPWILLGGGLILAGNYISLRERRG